jgi:hypothetical protein
MKARKENIKKYSDKGIKRSNLIIRATILILSSVVLYDSFKYNIPFYYILFLLAGSLIGRIFTLSHHVEFDENEVQLKLRRNHWAIFFLLLLLSGRFIIGPYVLNALHFVDPSDAILLFLIGIYHSKLHVVIKQIDNLFYRFLLTSTKKNENN